MPYPIAIFGIPIRNETTDEIVKECASITAVPKKDRHTNYACPINFKLFSNAHSWNYFTSIRHPELLKIARESIGIPNGKSLRLLSFLLGSPLQESINIKNFLIDFVKTLGSKSQALFFIGGTEKISKTAAIRLHDLAPGIKIVGIATPSVFVQGEDLIMAHERTLLFSEKINEPNPDALIINLGSPKQEIAFERAKRRLKPPLAIGVDNALNEIGTEISIPRWAFKWRLEWLFQFIHKIKSIHWIPSLYNFVKGIYMSVPLVIYHNLNRLVHSLSWKKSHASPLINTSLFISPYRSLAVIQLPRVIDKYNISALLQQIDQSMTQDTLILDFENVRHIQPEGFCLLIQTWQKMQKEKKEIFGLRVHPDVKLLMKVHRNWDFFKDLMCKTPNALMARIAHKIPRALYDAIYQDRNKVVVGFFGSIDMTVDYDSYIEKLIPTISQKDCIIDLNMCTSIDNTGLIFLLRLQKMLSQQGKSLRLCCVGPTILRQLKLANLQHQFKLCYSLESAVSNKDLCH